MMFDISFPVAFFGGVISFFAPCVVPLVPAYVGYVIGVSSGDLVKGTTHLRRRLVLSSIFYILGFSLVFVALGTAAAGVGQLLRQYDFWIQRVGGLLIIILGLNFAGLLPIPALARERRISPPAWFERLGYLRATGLGIVFATAWTPCVGAILGSILALAAVSGTAIYGAFLLFVYSLGISIPFIIVALTLAQAPIYFKAINKYAGIVGRVAGFLLALIGLLLLTDTYKFINAWLFEIAFRLGYKIR